jgi:TPR repeat protein
MTPKEQEQRNFVHTVNVLLTSALAERELARAPRRSPPLQLARRPYLSWPAAASVAIAALAITIGGYITQLPTMGIGGLREADTAATKLAAVDAKSRKAGSNERVQVEADVTAKARADAEAKRLADAAAAKERRAREVAAATRSAETLQPVEGAKRTKEERRQIASREEEPPAPAALPSPARPTQLSGRLLKVSVKVAGFPTNASKPWLGVNTEPLEPPLAEALGLSNANGAFLFDKTPGGPADRAGMQAGDVILSLNNASVANSDDLRQRLSLLTPGSEVVVEVWRIAGEAGDLLQMLRRLADAGNGQAMHRLGRMYAGSIGTPRDDGEAARWFRRGAEAGNKHAAAALGVALLRGQGVAKDPAEGVRLLRVAAGQDQVEAMNWLGHLLVEGRLVEKDPLEALRLFTKAAELGHAPSMADVGRMYAQGNGVAADPRKALMWFKQAADLGNAGGMAGLGWLYKEGKGVGADIGKAVAWYRRAADLGSPTAMADLALLHLQGKGVEQSQSAAVALFRKAADLGNPFAMNNLAWMLQGGYGVRKDPEEAADLMMKALAHRNEFSLKQMTQSSHAWSKAFREALQRKLRDAGVYAGPIDGEFSEPTTAAINAYVSRSPTPAYQVEPQDG